MKNGREFSFQRVNLEFDFHGTLKLRNAQERTAHGRVDTVLDNGGKGLSPRESPAAGPRLSLPILAGKFPRNAPRPPASGNHAPAVPSPHQGPFPPLAHKRPWSGYVRPSHHSPPPPDGCKSVPELQAGFETHRAGALTLAAHTPFLPTRPAPRTPASCHPRCGHAPARKSALRGHKSPGKAVAGLLLEQRAFCCAIACQFKAS